MTERAGRGFSVKDGEPDVADRSRRTRPGSEPARNRGPNVAQRATSQARPHRDHGPRQEAWRDIVVWFGLYYIGTGLWPIVHLRSFLAVTGPKQDTWLVQVFGALIASLGFSAILYRNAGPASAGVGLSAAVVLAAGDVFFVARRRIRATYLMDAALEILLAAGLARRPSIRSRLP